MPSTESSPRPTACRSCIVIPARLASTRLPRKLLLRETGKTVLQHTYESASRAQPAGVAVRGGGPRRDRRRGAGLRRQRADDRPGGRHAAPIAWRRWPATCPTWTSS